MTPLIKRMYPVRFDWERPNPSGRGRARVHLDGSPVVRADPCPFPHMRLFRLLPTTVPTSNTGPR